ncbi:hypothetical protein QQF64_033753 [Cirrhinus molitorella]|uniref:Reverse transcriptase RNase H-like domain-containing protein n=1 Tax=Cirrhinus molitorella TaxID=172907 RepID=A0ABR3MV25_9TELE
MEAEWLTTVLDSIGLEEEKMLCASALSEGAAVPADKDCLHLRASSMGPRLQLPLPAAGLGAVLSQVQDGEEYPVIYISRKLTSAER